ncbi:MAG: silent information regulator protein Sir2, partial [Phycisphaerae bacterium]|nr:silent information regulator protein Sir2 [Phycisphaerae bacterium]
MDPLYDPNAVLGWAGERIEERLNRGVVAVPTEGGKVYVGWRLLKTDPEGVAFHVYRTTAGGSPVRVNAEPVTRTTDLVDDKAPL